MTARRREVSSAVRLRVLQRDGYRCVYCGTNGADAELHVDHRVPVARGGSNHIGNLNTSCAHCNQSKGDGPEPARAQPMGLANGRVVALGLDGGRCVVGMVREVADEFVSLDLLDWFCCAFVAGERAVRRSDIKEVVFAELMSDDEADEEGWSPDSRPVFKCDPLGRFQSAWTKAHREKGVSS